MQHPQRLHSLLDLTTALRAGGVAIGSGSVLDANAAVAAMGVAIRDDVRHALRTALIREPADLALFEQLFDALFPRRSQGVAGTEALAAQSQRAESAPSVRRLADSLASLERNDVLRGPDREEHVATGTESSIERLATKDFAQMSAVELHAARRLLSDAPARTLRRRSRRWESDPAGRRIDLRRMLRSGRFDMPLYRRLQWRLRDWVLLVDISGSMAVYSRMFLHFAHALTRRAGRMETFVFATRLTRITRQLREADPDRALQAATVAVPDWDGGTRLGECLAEFNRLWARRTLARGAQVLLLTDGLERSGVEILETALPRLARSCHELIWINPLLRSPHYQPLAAGAAVLARHSHRAASAHNIQSVLGLIRLLDGVRRH